VKYKLYWKLKKRKSSQRVYGSLVAKQEGGGISMSEQKEGNLKERLDFVKQYIGKKYDREKMWQILGLPKGCDVSNTSASIDNIRRYVDGIGDLNPRFRDLEYSKRTKYGCLVAPPLFLMTICVPYQGMVVIRDARPFYSGSEWQFFRPILEDDKLDFNGYGTAGVELKKSRFSGQMLVTTSLYEYRNHRAEVVALVKGFVHHSSSDQVSAGMGKYKEVKIQRYSAEELRRIEEDYAKEEMRGSQPRYWEDVAEGEYTPHVVNGPHTIWDTIAFIMGRPHGINKGSRLYRRTVATGHADVPSVGQQPFDPTTNTYVHTEMPHFDNDLAKAIGVPGAYDLGPERECLVATLFDNWMGDDGFLWKYSIQFHRFVITGDTNWYQAKVVRKYVDDGKCCVDLEHWGNNQMDEQTTVGRATVILPSKTYGPVKYPPMRSLNEVFPLKD
jgi:hypothetical protein